MKTTRKRRWGWICGMGTLALALGVFCWVRRFHHYTPVEVVQDLRAAAAARNAPRPVERFLELRYGTLSDSANRQKAFLDFFNVGHIEGLQILVSRAPASRREPAIRAMADWVAGYREAMTPQEKQALAAVFQTDSGRAMLERATSRYLKQDVHYRGATAPVIEELMKTLAAVRAP
jgi:hypothetical protein